MASDEPTSDESDESSSEASSEESSGGESKTASSDSLDFGSKAAEAEDSNASDEPAEPGSEPEAAADAGLDDAADDDTDGAADDDADDDTDAENTADEDAAESDEEEPYDPNKIPPLSERATLFGAWGCMGLVIVVTLVFFVLVKSAIDKIDDYGAVASDDESDEPSVERPTEEPEEPTTRPSVARRLEWPTSYPEARDAARIDERPIVIVFTAEYATESLDVFDGVFSNDDIENYLERFFQIVHIDMGTHGTDPSIALCEVEFLPHVCYLHPETEAKLNADTTGMIGTSALLRELTTARVAYEASAEADGSD